MIFWKEDVTREEYDNEQKNPASLGGSSSIVHSVLKSKIKNIAEIDNFTKHICRMLDDEEENLLDGTEADTASMKRLNEAIAIALGTKEVKERKSKNSMEALNFGTLLHDILLEDNLADYEIVGSGSIKVSSYTNIIKTKSLTEDLKIHLAELKEKFDKVFLNAMGISLKNCNAYIEKGFIKYHPKTSVIYPHKSGDITHKEKPSFRMKCDIMYISGDILYIVDFKTAKDYLTFSSSIASYKCQLIFYFLCLFDQWRFLKGHSINQVCGRFIVFDKSSKDFKVSDEFIIFEDFSKLPACHYPLGVFGNFVEDTVYFGTDEDEE